MTNTSKKCATLKPPWPHSCIVYISQQVGAVHVSVCGQTDKTWDSHTTLLSLKKEGNCDTYYNMDEPWGSYMKWNKPDMERQMLHDPTCIKYLERWDSQRHYIEWRQGLGGRQQGGVIIYWVQTLILGRQKEGWTVGMVAEGWVYLMPLNWTLKSGYGGTLWCVYLKKYQPWKEPTKLLLPC